MRKIRKLEEVSPVDGLGTESTPPPLPESLSPITDRRIINSINEFGDALNTR